MARVCQGNLLKIWNILLRLICLFPQTAKIGVGGGGGVDSVISLKVGGGMSFPHTSMEVSVICPRV